MFRRDVVHHATKPPFAKNNFPGFFHLDIAIRQNGDITVALLYGDFFLLRHNGRYCAYPPNGEDEEQQTGKPRLGRGMLSIDLCHSYYT